VKVIIASGLFDSKLKGELIAAGVDGFLQKPYKPDEIIVLLQDVLKRRQMVNGQW
jgi:DNA-binding NarL/FixJ family response regulator